MTSKASCAQGQRLTQQFSHFALSAMSACLPARLLTYAQGALPAWHQETGQPQQPGAGGSRPLSTPQRAAASEEEVLEGFNGTAAGLEQWLQEQEGRAGVGGQPRQQGGGGSGGWEGDEDGEGGRDDEELMARLLGRGGVGGGGAQKGAGRKRGVKGAAAAAGPDDDELLMLQALSGLEQSRVGAAGWEAHGRGAGQEEEEDEEELLMMAALESMGSSSRALPQQSQARQPKQQPPRKQPPRKQQQAAGGRQVLKKQPARAKK